MIFRRFLFSGLALFFLTAVTLTAQRGKGNSLSNVPIPDVSSFIVSGSVALPDGIIPSRIVQIERVCGGRTVGVTYADSKGRYSFDLGFIFNPSKPTSGGEPAESFADCIIRASLEGYRAQTIALGPAVKSAKPLLAAIVLQPVGKTAAIMSDTDARISKNAKKDYEKGLDLMAAKKWPEALATMQKAASEDAKFATAWVSVGTLQASLNDNDGALQSYAKAISADDKFAEPYIDLAVLQTAAAQWDKVIENTEKVISLDADAFPRAYYLNTMANIRLKKMDAAMKNVAQGIRVDQDHLFPDLQYMQGILLINKGDMAGARAQLESYLALAPKGDNAQNASDQLKNLPAAK
ncbi:MAG: tetratricopeptide repeat protein [Bryobacteraceae bacterium]